VLSFDALSVETIDKSGGSNSVRLDVAEKKVELT
jgi:hypothetical protein